jgi:surface glycoprotein (TIGR04207 family)
MTARHRSIALAALLVLSLVAAALAVPGTVTAQSQPEIYTVDADHDLATDDAIQRFEQEGLASTQLERLDLRLTVADEAGDAGLSDLRHSSSLHTYVQVEYDEEIPRTIRIYLPSAYVDPYRKVGLEAEDTDVTADVESVRDREMVALTLTVDGPTNATFALNHAAGKTMGARERVKTLINQSTGIRLPDVPIGSGGAEWQYVPSSALAGNNTTYRVPTDNDTDSSDLTIQYDSDPGPDERWLPVQECDGSQQICTITKNGSDRVVLVSTVETPPTVRYRQDGGALIGARSIGADLGNAVDELVADVKGLWPGGD